MNRKPRAVILSICLLMLLVAVCATRYSAYQQEKYREASYSRKHIPPAAIRAAMNTYLETSNAEGNRINSLHISAAEKKRLQYEAYVLNFQKLSADLNKKTNGKFRITLKQQ